MAVNSDNERSFVLHPSASSPPGSYPAAPEPQQLVSLWINLRHALRRRWGAMLAAGAAVMILTGLAAYFWPPTYRSTGTILIEQQEVPQDLVRSDISSYADERVQMITQRATASANLLDIIDKYNLYRDERRTETREALVAKMRHDIRVNMISAEVMDPREGRATRATIAFSISYDSRSPLVAAEVANELTSLYLRENLETREKQAADTVDFLDSEAKRLGAQTSALEQKLADFRAKNEKELPEFTQLNVQLTSRAQDDLQDLSARERSLHEQIVFLQAQLAQTNPNATLFSDGQRVLGTDDELKLLETQYAKAVILYTDKHPYVLALKSQIEGLKKELGSQTTYRETERQIDQDQAELAAMRTRYTDNHPDVIRLTQDIAQLKAQLKNEPQTPADPIRGREPDNPAYIQIEANLKGAEAERTSLLTQEEQLRTRLAELEQQSAAMPMVERDYNALLGELDSTKKQYADIQQKQMEAELASNLETERKGERFTLIEPPLEPQKPVSPNRTMILGAGLVLALGAAITLMRLLEALDTRIRGRNDLIALLSVPPLAVIPRLKLGS